MELIGRQEELAELRRIRAKSMKESRFTVISGRRRVGKTELVEKALKDGENEIAVDVTSTWHNRLIVDAGLPEPERQTWTILGWNGPQKGQPFAPSGWVGPARLVFAGDAGAAAEAQDDAGKALSKEARNGLLVNPDGPVCRPRPL